MLTIYAYGVYKIYHFKRSLMQTMQVQCSEVKGMQ